MLQRGLCGPELAELQRHVAEQSEREHVRGNRRAAERVARRDRRLGGACGLRATSEQREDLREGVADLRGGVRARAVTWWRRRRRRRRRRWVWRRRRRRAVAMSS